MQKEKLRSFKLSPESMFKETGFRDMSKKGWWRFKRMTKNEYRNTAGLCIGLGAFFVPILFPIGVISGIVWIYLLIKEKFKNANTN